MAFDARAYSAVARSCIRAELKHGLKTGITQSEAESRIYEIANSIGLAPSGIVVVDCGSLHDGEALYSDGQDGFPQGEYIVYNESWVRLAAGTDPTQLYFILGHEFGHLVNRHALKPNVSQHDKELQADAFGACAVARMNGNWDALEELVRKLRGDFPTNYPSADESVEAAKRSYASCGGVLTAEAGEPQEASGWIYVGVYDNGWSSSSTLSGLDAYSPEDLEGQYLKLNRGANLRDGPFKATAQLANGGCKNSESNIIGGLSAKSTVRIDQVYRLEGDWCSHFIWAQVSPVP
ncbi:MULTISPECIES: M48 family metalloprotease [unclassified Rhizobium]|uniref:M48 family metalloprotease n=1 Tax=unclassified Rhizobium TaxID=2613769 RepID=UPI00138F37F2|nr:MULTISPECIES: M48 family metalloprotease [unclassified Rhizobium]